jgi:hypothetical protein
MTGMVTWRTAMVVKGPVDGRQVSVPVIPVLNRCVLRSPAIGRVESRDRTTCDP